MSPRASDPPVPILTVLDRAVDAVLGGSWGWLRVPAGGDLSVAWLSKKGCYRLTIDVTPGHPLDDDAPSYNLETRRRIESAL